MIDTPTIAPLVPDFEHWHVIERSPDKIAYAKTLWAQIERVRLQTNNIEADIKNAAKAITDLQASLTKYNKRSKGPRLKALSDKQAALRAQSNILGKQLAQLHIDFRAIGVIRTYPYEASFIRIARQRLSEEVFTRIHHEAISECRGRPYGQLDKRRQGAPVSSKKQAQSQEAARRQQTPISGSTEESQPGETQSGGAVQPNAEVS